MSDENFKLDGGAIAPELPVQNDTASGDLFAHLHEEDKEVVCLGQTFKNNAARRAHFTALLAEKLKDPEFRKIEGFPLGTDEDILALSDPPYYCACPNPWLGDFIKEWEAAKPKRKGRYQREPFAADVSEGKNDPIYNAHSYHTKVPHKAIMRYILHYTEPGDIVFDGFCGTGMTGVAAQMCGDRKTVESLGYKVNEKGEIRDPHGEDPDKVISHLGARKAVLNDLSPAATFIAYNYNTPVDVARFSQEAKRILAEVEKECGWMYETQHVDADGKPILGMDGKPVMGKINYVVWTDVFICPHCGKEVVFWDVAVSSKDYSVADKFRCRGCNSELAKRNLVKNWESFLDFDGSVRKRVKKIPCLVHYKFGDKYYIKKPDRFDEDVLSKVEVISLSDWIPTDELVDGDKTSDPKSVGVTKISDFYFKRALRTLARFRSLSEGNPYFNTLVSMLTSSCVVLSKQYRFRSQNGSLGAGGGPMNGTLYVPSLIKEIPVLKVLNEHLSRFCRTMSTFKRSHLSLISTYSSLRILDAKNGFDYIFVDPPFGANLMYSELNSIWEGWLRCKTNSKEEAIENRSQNKGSFEYRALMRGCFERAYKLLKPGGWMTVEFSNTSAVVWNGIQDAIGMVGFVVANVSALDKKQGSFNAVNNPTSVKQDLVISAYKPDADFEVRFKKEAATEDGVWDFVRSHLEKLPVAKMRGGVLEFVQERDPRILFDKVVAYYFLNGFTVPVSAKQFQDGLRARFTEDDGMFFLPDQHAEYMKQKAKSTKLVQAELFVSDESSAIAWLRQSLKEKPQTYQSIQPGFMQQLKAWNKFEKQIELRDLLVENFRCYDGQGPVPNPIHTYLSTQYHDLRNLKDDDPRLRAKGKDLWYVPNPKDAAEVEAMRERSLLKEFETYKTEKKVKTPRIEALRIGFQTCYEAHDYKTIAEIAKKIPEDVREGDAKLVRYYDRAMLHLEG